MVTRLTLVIHTLLSLRCSVSHTRQDRVFSQSSTNHEVFDEVGKRIVTGCMTGTHLTQHHTSFTELVRRERNDLCLWANVFRQNAHHGQPPSVPTPLIRQTDWDPL